MKAVNESKTAKEKADAEAEQEAKAEQEAAAQAAAAAAQAQRQVQSYTPSYTNTGTSSGRSYTNAGSAAHPRDRLAHRPVRPVVPAVRVQSAADGAIQVPVAWKIVPSQSNIKPVDSVSLSGPFHEHPWDGPFLSPARMSKPESVKPGCNGIGRGIAIPAPT